MNPARHTNSTPAFRSSATTSRSYSSRASPFDGIAFAANSSRLRAREARRAFAVADHKRDFRARNAPGRNAIGQRLEIRSAPRQQHPNAM